MTHCIQPVDLPLVRHSAISAVSQEAAEIYRHWIEQGRQPVVPAHLSPQAGGQYMADSELARLRLSELYFVTANMMSLARTAAASLPEFSLVPEDLPSPAGLIVFETPIRSLHGSYGWDGQPIEVAVDIIAASWGPFWRAPSPAVWVTWYSDARRTFEGMSALSSLSPARIAELRARSADRYLNIDNETQFFFGVAATREDIVAANATLGKGDAWTGDVEWAAEDTMKSLTLRTIWTLLQQPSVTSNTELPLPRAARRRYQRLEVPVSPVRVISLRHGPSAGAGDGEAREYHHQWVVRGHWRQQWHPSRQEHRPIWITPHIKGPEGAPLLGGEKVYALRK